MRKRTAFLIANRKNEITCYNFWNKVIVFLESFELKQLNVLVGANGAGKSNLLGFFELLGWMIRGQNLQEHIAIKGGGDGLLLHFTLLPVVWQVLRFDTFQ